MFTDSHIHLYLKEFDDDRNLLIKNAIDNNITKFLLPNIDNSTLPQLLNLHKQNPNLFFPMIGLHPCSVTKNYKHDLDLLYESINLYPFIGVGEVGIDLYWEQKFIQEQKEAFKLQINWAKKHHLPLIIHCRNSFNEVYDILKSEKSDNLYGVFHCFSGTLEEAQKIIDLGFYLGIGGIITFKNSQLPNVIEQINLKHLVVETDAPFLTPHPMRGKRNEPRFLTLIIDKIAKIKNTTSNIVGEITNQNIDDIFFKKFKNIHSEK